KNTNLIYTATVGDSEAKIYRSMKGKLKSIPLSNVRDWSFKKEAIRAFLATQDPKILETWIDSDKPKKLRFNPQKVLFGGINACRAFGDKQFAEVEGKAGLIVKPKITVQELKPGDRLFYACDGYWDFVK